MDLGSGPDLTIQHAPLSKQTLQWSGLVMDGKNAGREQAEPGQVRLRCKQDDGDVQGDSLDLLFLHVMG